VFFESFYEEADFVASANQQNFDCFQLFDIAGETILARILGTDYWDRSVCELSRGNMSKAMNVRRGTIAIQRSVTID